MEGSVQKEEEKLLMDIFSSFPQSKVKLIKQDGRSYVFKATVQTKLIFSTDVTLPIEEGDIIERAIANNGIKERYLILDRGFYDEFQGIPAHYQMKVEKTTKPMRQLSNNTTTINAYGNAKVNYQSIDNSINRGLTQEEAKQFDELYTTIESISNNADILEGIKELQASAKDPSFKEKYINFVSVAADHMTVLAPFIPFLTSFLE